MSELITYEIQPVKNSVINLDGWRIVRSDGSVLLPFTTKRQAEQLIEFFAPEALKRQALNEVNGNDRR